MIPSGHPVVVAIPVRDEEACLAACLDALDCQTGESADDIVLLLNNCRDGSARVAARARPVMRTRLHVIDVSLSDHQANAGHARRLAMQEAARLAGRSGIILTTDADGRVDPDWVGANLNALRAGADAVAGWVELDPIDWGAIPASLHEDDARERAYDDACDALCALLDPDPANPYPRHTQCSGASLGVTAAMYAEVGGLPDIPSGEDRAFVAALRRIDARVRHAPECHVVVSGRIDGRAAGGMADTIRRRLSAPDPFLDDMLEPAQDCARRAALRHFAAGVHRTGQGGDVLCFALGLEKLAVERAMGCGRFGLAWEALSNASGALRRRRVAATDVVRQQSEALRLLRWARVAPAACRERLIGFIPALRAGRMG